MNKPGVYSITHTTSGKVYVGSSVNIRVRWNAHRRELRAGTHHSPKLQRAWDKYGEAAFDFAVLEETTDLLPREQHWMNALGAVGAKGYNVSPVAGLVQAPGPRRPHTDAAKAKIRAKRALQVITPEGAAKTAAALRGRKRSPEACAAIATGKKGKPFSDSHRAAIAKARTGTTIPDETRAKMSAAAKGHVKSAEHCAALSKALTGKKLSPEAIAKRTATRRANGNY